MEEKFLDRAIELAKEGMEENQGGPFGCVVVKNGEIIGEGCNLVTSKNDPTAHAEIIAIRDACRHLSHFQLTDCDIYASCEPCPMCLGAIYWARPRRVYFAATREDASNAGFDDDFIYHELDKSPSERRIPMISHLRDDARMLFESWIEKEDKIDY